MALTKRLIISGKVQGVFYRQTAMEKAREFGIRGTVRNLDDGNVEIIATGTKEQLEKMTAWCHEGPPRAKVDNVRVEELPLQQFDRFSVIRS